MSSRKRPSLIPILTALALALATVPAPARAESDLWVHLEVGGGKEEARMSLNLPISALRTGASFFPDADASGKIVVDGREISIAEMRSLWRQVKGSRDATFFSVDNADGRIRVAKQGEYLVVKALDRAGTNRGTEIETRLPVPVVDALLSGPGDRFDVAAAVEALARHGSGELTTVNDEGERVRLWVDRSPDSGR